MGNMEVYYHSCLTLTSRLLIIIKIMIMMLHIIASADDVVFDVLNYGAKSNGKDDVTQSFLDAWSAACNLSHSTQIYVPKGRYLVGRPLTFIGGGCNNPAGIAFKIDGTLVAPLDYNIIGQATNWIGFQGVRGVSIIGGALDGSGAPLWACKLAATQNSCPNGAATLSFTNSNNVKIGGLVSLNSQFFHIVINGCQNVNVEGVKVMASSDSPNTDGIHVQYSTNVTITNTFIKTGDDCISIGPGTSNLWIEGVRCGPGHGISIGSLGRDLEEPGVQNVTVKSSLFADTQNGFRIKSWARPSNGFVQGVRFISAIMQNVRNPIIIDQHYCPHTLNCPNQVSGIKVRDVTFRGIRGTSATAIAIKLDCSSKYPCTGIRLENVNLTYLNQPSQSSCANVAGKALGLIQPDGCL